MYIKHSKYKNTGILFEILVKRITSDTLSGSESPAVKILKKYYTNTELSKEYKLYETILNSKNKSENVINSTLSTVLDLSKNLNKGKLKREKYNLIKELKSKYNLDKLFKIQLNNYKTQAAIYTLFEIYSSENITDPNQIIDNKVTILENLTIPEIDKQEVKDDLIEEFKSYDKDLRTLTYYTLLEKFNTKYSNLSNRQKNVLREFITSSDSTTELKEFYNKEIDYIKEAIATEYDKINNEVVKIKLNEVSKLIKKLTKRSTIKSDHLVDLLQFHNLVEEISKVNA